MRILLISPASGQWRGIAKRRGFSGKTFRFSMLSLLTLAELSPPESEITLIDEQVEGLPEGEAFDLVGVTAMTSTAPRAYEIARRFRARGIPVVLGGFHPSLNPEEALQHADAIVVGPAYGAWERLLGDLRAGRLQRIYRGDLDGRIPVTLPRHLVRRRDYLTVNSTFASLGCRNACQFCSITRFHGGRRRTRPVEEVVSEVASFREGFLIFVDDNLTQDRDHARALLRGLAPLRKRWVTQASIDVADDEEMLHLLRCAGCVGLFIGLESFSERALCAQSKSFNSPEHCREAVSRIHHHGMFVEAGLIFGHDSDDVGVFRRTLAMLDRIGIDAIQLSVLTPLPGTPLFERMRDRIFDLDWEHCNYRQVVFQPCLMSADDLQAGADWVIRSFYSPWRVARRLLRWITMPRGLSRFIYPLGLNMAYLGRVRRFGIRGRDPGRGGSTVCGIPALSRR
ncbi:B12-binding domain-containing radical SAM protein [Candidatus Sumerlaeota bacterium]|nr:B12-binding domain-containing radical SAM protein [Candidatus Sumerlaeota bacterium]